MSAGSTWRKCGHSRTAANTLDGMCRTCRLAYRRADHRSPEGRLIYRMRYLPTQLERTRRKLRALEAEASRYGMTELLEVRP